MKMSKKMRTLASALLSAAMVTAMGGMTAFADPGTTSTGVQEPNGQKQITITKEILVESGSNAMAPSTTFNFTVEPTSDYINQSADTTNKVPVYAGVAGGVEGSTSITFTAGADLTEAGTITVNPSAFNNYNPGIYRYKVTEGNVTFDGMTKDDTVYYLDVYVINGESGKEIPYVLVSKYDETQAKLEKADLTFKNTYTTYDLTVTKHIEGNQGVKTTPFNFTITINGAASEKYNYTVNGTSNQATADANGEAKITVSLSDTQNVVIKGLSAGDTYTVVENDANTDGYTTTYYDGAYDTNNKNTNKANSITGVVQGSSNREVNVLNYKNVSTPTGIVMNFAPYILLVALAGVFAVLFLRKRREEF